MMARNNFVASAITGFADQCNIPNSYSSYDWNAESGPVRGFLSANACFPQLARYNRLMRHALSTVLLNVTLALTTNGAAQAHKRATPPTTDELAHAQEPERGEARVTLPLTSSKLSTTVDLSTGADREPQQRLGLTVDFASLPDAHRPQAVAPPENSDSQQSGTASLSGTVIDKNGAVFEGAQVTLTGPPGSPVRSVQSGSNGQFEFTGLTPDIYKLTVNAPGMSTFISPEIPLHADEFRILTPVTLSVSPVTTTVIVSAGKNEQLSKEQLHIAEQQRIVGIIPNFYSSYDWNAPPMLAKHKFQLSIRSIIDPVSFLTVAARAGVEQHQNAFPEYGSGIEGYGKRYGAAFANHVSATLLGRAVYPSIFHQDPRYFYNGKGTIGSRVLYAISTAVIARGDDGRWKPNYSRILGNFSAAAISNLYYPTSDRGASLVLVNGLAGIGENAVSNLVREFVLKRFTSHVPKGANGQP